MVWAQELTLGILVEATPAKHCCICIKGWCVCRTCNLMHTACSCLNPPCHCPQAHLVCVTVHDIRSSNNSQTKQQEQQWTGMRTHCLGLALLDGIGMEGIKGCGQSVEVPALQAG